MMADVSVRLLILLDPQNSHSCYDEKINYQIFRRCENSQECRDHIINQTDRDKHLFLPDFETELAKHPHPGLSSTYIYLYCHNESFIGSPKPESSARALTRIFMVDELPFYLYHAGIELLHKLLRKPPKELNENMRNKLVSMAKQQLRELNQLYDQYVEEKLSKEAIELH